MSSPEQSNSENTGRSENFLLPNSLQKFTKHATKQANMTYLKEQNKCQETKPK
jgi:hypothetical protein